MNRKKGMQALEIVFMMFILIVVALVVIKLFSGLVTEDKLPKIDDFQNAYNVQKESLRCSGLCSAYKSNGDVTSAVSFCREKVNVDINGDYRSGERKAYGIVAGIPYCEDGLYCFHIYKCEYGFVALDAKECLSIMKDYYYEKSGGSEATANSAVCKAVKPGECEKNPKLWPRKLPGYEPIMIEDGIYAGQVWGADFWWKLAGYGDICTAETPTPTATTTPSESVRFKCSASGTKISCTWSGCPSTGEVILVLSPGSDTRMYENKASGDELFDELDPNKYIVVMTCGDTTRVSEEMTIK